MTTHRPAAAGVTGHRSGGLEGSVPSLLANQVDDVLRILRGAGIDTLVSALAEGADRLVAHRALQVGWTLRALLPFPPPRYEEDFPSEDSREEFRDLLGRAREVEVLEAMELPEPAAVLGSVEGLDSAVEMEPVPLAYRRVGEALLDRCAVLLAIWDGEPPRGPGGTAEVVSGAAARGIPVLWIHSAPPHAVRLLDGSTAAAPHPSAAGEPPGPLLQELAARFQRTRPPERGSP